MPSAATWPTETSSPPTSFWLPMAIRCSLTSTWHATGRRRRRPALSMTPGEHSPTWLPSDCAALRWTIRTAIIRARSDRVPSWNQSRIATSPPVRPVVRARPARYRAAPGRHLFAGNGHAGGPHRTAPWVCRGVTRFRAGDRLSPAENQVRRIRRNAGRECAGRGPRVRARPTRIDRTGPCAILERCLDPDPSRRYRRGMELAQDLDRWRTDRPLVYTSEPFWGQTVPRLVRRQRRTLVAAGLSLILILATTAVALVKSHQTLQALGLHKMGRMWDDPEARAHRFQRPQAPRLLQPDLSHVESAVRALKEYDVLGADDWRRRDDVQALPEAEREDLEVWLMEQVYLYCQALADRPNSPADWRRALEILGHVARPDPIPAFAALELRLNTNLGARGSVSPAASAVASSVREPSWVNEYLLGVMAECELGSSDHDPLAFGDARDDMESNQQGLDRNPDRTRHAAEQALTHYKKFLVRHPDSFWGHYRAASASNVLSGSVSIAETAGHLEHCIARRPNNPILHHHLAVCLMELDRHRDAQREIEIAIEEAPDAAEFYRTRADIQASLRQTGGLAADLNRFELLSHMLPRAFWSQRPAESGHSPALFPGQGSTFPCPFQSGAASATPRQKLQAWETSLRPIPRRLTPAPSSPRDFAKRANPSSPKLSLERSC